MPTDRALSVEFGETAGLAGTRTSTGDREDDRLSQSSAAVWSLANFQYRSFSDRVEATLVMKEANGNSPQYSITVVEHSKLTSPPDGGGSLPPERYRLDVTVHDLYSFECPLERLLPIIPPDDPLVASIRLMRLLDDATMIFSIGLHRQARSDVIIAHSPVKLTVRIFY